MKPRGPWTLTTILLCLLITAAYGWLNVRLVADSSRGWWMAGPEPFLSFGALAILLLTQLGAVYFTYQRQWLPASVSWFSIAFCTQTFALPYYGCNVGGHCDVIVNAWSPFTILFQGVLGFQANRCAMLKISPTGWPRRNPFAFTFLFLVFSSTVIAVNLAYFAALEAPYFTPLALASLLLLYPMRNRSVPANNEVSGPGAPA